MDESNASIRTQSTDYEINFLSNTWVASNLLRVETALILSYVVYASLSTDLVVPIFYLIGISAGWFIIKMLSSWLTVVILIALTLIPIVGWLVLIALFFLRLRWFTRNVEACVISAIFVVAPLFIPAGGNQKFYVAALVLLSIFLLTYLYALGYSALEVLDVFLTMPVALIAAGSSIHHMISSAGGDHGGDFREPQQQTHIVIKQSEPNADHSHPPLESVKAHVRTHPDGIETNNLSYTGPHVDKPADTDVNVTSYARTKADASVTNNLSAHNSIAQHDSAFAGDNHHFITHNGAATNIKSLADKGGFSPEILQISVASVFGPTSEKMNFSERYIKSVIATTERQRRVPLRLKSATRRRLSNSDRAQFLSAFDTPRQSQWERLKGFISQAETLDMEESWTPPLRFEWSRAKVAMAFSMESKKVLEFKQPELPGDKATLSSKVTGLFVAIYGCVVGLVSTVVMLHPNPATSWENPSSTGDLTGSFLLKLIRLTGLKVLLVRWIEDEVPYASGNLVTFPGPNRRAAPLVLALSIILVCVVAPKIVKSRSRKRSS